MPLALIALSLASAAPAAQPGLSAGWTRIEGSPRDGCLARMYEINVAPDFALLADSADQRFTWAVTADARGLSVIACSGGDVQSDLISGRVTGDKVDLVFKLLLSVTHEALGPAADVRQRARYSDEIGALRGSLRRTLPLLIRDAQRLHPGFLKKEPEMPRPPQF